MKIVCDACAAVYSIADDKVRGKVFKIRCKKCSHVVIVRGAEAVPVEEPAPAAVPVAGAGAAGEDEPRWYVVMDEQQVGPLGVAAVQAHVAAGALDGGSYVWAEGLADWMPLAEVPELAAPREAGGNAHVEAARDAGAGAGAMRGQRNESSILFSLGSLAALAGEARGGGGGGGAGEASAETRGGEGSGLLDIRSMASAYLGPSRPAAARVGSADDLPVFTTAAFHEPAVIVPMGAPRQDRTLRMLAIAVGVLAAAAIVLAIVVLGRSESTPPRTTAAIDRERATEPLSAPPTASAPVVDRAERPADPPIVTAPVATPPAAAPLASPPAATPPAPASPAPAASPPRRGASVRTPPTSSPATGPRSPSRSNPPAAAGTCNLDETGCLLADRRPACCEIYAAGRRLTPTTTGPTRTAPPPPADDDLPEALTRSLIAAGLATVQSRATACGAKSTAKGKVKVGIKVAPAGNVTRVGVVETPDPSLGACVASAVQKATFARTRTGGSFEFPYRF